MLMAVHKTNKDKLHKYIILLKKLSAKIRLFYAKFSIKNVQ